MVVVLFSLSMIAQHPRFLCEHFIVSRDRSRLATRPEVFAGIETECGNSPHRPSYSPAIFLFREILRAVGLAGVFNDDQLVMLGYFQKRIHIGHLSIKIDRNDGCNRLTTLVVDHNTKPVVDRAEVLQILTYSCWIHVVGA